MRKKVEPKILVVLSDLHCGSTVGLLPPGFTAQDGNEIRQNRYQEWLWECWTDATGDYFRRHVGDEPFVLLLNGDLIEGIHAKSNPMGLWLNLKNLLLKRKDLSGLVIADGQILDLGGKTISVTKPIRLGKLAGIQNGTIDGTALAKFDSGLQLVGYGAWVSNVKFYGGSYNGLAKVFANNCILDRCTILPKTGWGIQVLGADQCTIRGLKLSNSRRGGVYWGSGVGYPSGKEECNDCILENSDLVNSDEEALVRANTAQNLIIRECRIDNTGCRVGKEALQLRGRSGVVHACKVYGSTSSGQQPNGVKQAAKFVFSDCTIYGYNSVEAGGDITFDNCELINRPTWNGYTLKTQGNGTVIACQSAAVQTPFLSPIWTLGFQASLLVVRRERPG